MSNFFLPWAFQKDAKRLPIASAEGIWLTLKDGRKIADFSSHIFNANIGHGHPKIKEAFRQYAEDPRVMLPGAENTQADDLASKLASKFPHSQPGIKTFFTVGGAEACEHAVKIARMVTGKHKVITRYRSYHGSTIAMMNHSGDPRRIPTEGGVTGVVRFPDPYERGSGQKFDTVRLLEEIIEVEGPETIAAVMLEGLTGTNGVFLPPLGYWERIREICSYHNIILIADEIMSGCGRTGKWQAIDHHDVRPDIITHSKGLAGGYAPLGAIVCDERISNHFDDHLLASGLTGYAPQVSVAVANRCFDIYWEEGLVENAANRGSELADLLSQLTADCEIVAECRNVGLMGVIELHPLANPPVATPIGKSKEDAARGNKIKNDLMAAGIFTFIKPTQIFVAPPLCITKGELADGVEKIKSVLNSAYSDLTTRSRSGTKRYLGG